MFHTYFRFLRHSFFFGIVTMEQWMCIRLMSHGLIKSVHNKRNVVTTADFKSYDPAVIEIQYGA